MMFLFPVKLFKSIIFLFENSSLFNGSTSYSLGRTVDWNIWFDICLRCALQEVWTYRFLSNIFDDLHSLSVWIGVRRSADFYHETSGLGVWSGSIFDPHFCRHLSLLVLHLYVDHHQQFQERDRTRIGGRLSRRRTCFARFCFNVNWNKQNKTFEKCSLDRQLLDQKPWLRHLIKKKEFWSNEIWPSDQKK